MEGKVFLETFLMWVRTSANFEEVPWLIIEPLRSLISGLRLKQFPKLFYSQNSRVPETIVFQALFSRRKVFSLYLNSFKNKTLFLLKQIGS